MSEQTNIEWCDSTWSPWLGCTKVGPGCDHCYAEAMMDTRLHKVHWGAGQPRVRTSVATWRQPVKWNKEPFHQCPACGWRGDGKDAPKITGLLGVTESWCPSCSKATLMPARRRVFCSSLADVFDNEIDPQWRVDLLRLIADTPNLDWLLLTKRIGNAHSMMVDAFKAGWPNHKGQWERWPELFRNIWLGATIVNQAEADRDIPKLLDTPARVRFLSMEPMLGPVDLMDVRFSRWARMDVLSGTGISTGPGAVGQSIPNAYCDPINWVIVGGESGPNARPMHPNWVRSLRDQCAAAGVPILFKQWGEWAPRSSCYHVDENGLSFADKDPGAQMWPCIRLTERGHNGHDLANSGCGDDAYMQRVGKKAAGNLLDGVQHLAWPEVAP